MALTLLALGVLQTEACFVALSHFSSVGCQDIIVSEDVHAMVVPAETETMLREDTQAQGFYIMPIVIHGAYRWEQTPQV